MFVDLVVDILVFFYGYVWEDGIVMFYIFGIDIVGNGCYCNDCDNDMFGKFIYVCYFVFYLMG